MSRPSSSTPTNVAPADALNFSTQRRGRADRSARASPAPVNSIVGAVRRPIFGEQSLRGGAVILKPVAECAAADDVIALRPKLVLKLAEADGLEEDQAVIPGFADPVELRPPIGSARDHPGHRTGSQRIADADADLVAIVEQPKVHGAQVAGLRNAQNAHNGLIAQGTLRARKPVCPVAWRQFSSGVPKPRTCSTTRSSSASPTGNHERLAPRLPDESAGSFAGERHGAARRRVSSRH